MAIIATLVGIFVGMLVNNVFTWKIKNQIEYIDHLIKHLLQLNAKYEVNDKSENINNTEMEVIFANQLLNNVFGTKLQEYRRLIRCYNDKSLSNRGDFYLNANGLLAEIINDALLERKRLTSFYHMLKDILKELYPLKCRCNR